MTWAALALALSAAAAAPAPSQDADVAQLVRDACVATELDRAAFERLGRERRWRSVRLTQRSGRSGWSVAFRAEGATIMLMGGRAPDNDPADAPSCSVSVEHAPEGLEQEIDALAAALGLASEGALEAPAGMVPIRMWSRFGDSTLTFAAAQDGRAVVSFSRQHVTRVAGPAPVN